MSSRPRLGLFEAYGIEIEYMVVDRDSLEVRSIVDEVFKAATGEYASDFEDGLISWSNELVSHVIELKGTGPVPSLKNLESEFHRSLTRINEILGKMNACLMPTAMHPWMDPMSETKLWAHDNNEVYDAYNRIFDCKGHGWSNLQSMHVNLPFKNDQEFASLHTAIRCLLPLLPALSASSPVMDGVPYNYHDNRLRVYQTNQRRVPSIAGHVVPEPVMSEAQYREEVLGQIFKEIAPHDPDSILREEWLNSRGAIARFDRNAIEIRVLDCQECPRMDIAIADFITATLKMLIHRRPRELQASLDIETADLKLIFDRVSRDAENALISESAILKSLGLDAPPQGTSAREVWQKFLNDPDVQKEMSPEHVKSIEFLIENGTLATRIQRRLVQAGQKLNEVPELNLKSYGQAGRKTAPSAALKEIYRELCTCLSENRFFI